MAEQNRTTLKNYFQTGDRPSQAQYADLIDSQLNLAETGTQIMVGILSSSGLEVTGDITASNNASIGGRTSTVDLTVSSLGSTQIPFIQAGSDGIFDGSGLFTFLGGTLSVPNITQVTTTNIETTGNGHITASGNISSSNEVLGLTGSFERLDATTSSISILESTSINVTGDITASNITASGVIKASTGVFGTNTTTIDDNIDTTGNLTVNNSLLNISNGNIIASGIISASGITTTALTIAGAIFGQSTDTFWASGSSGEIYYNGGNVGIGTTDPLEKLHVIGNISSSGTLGVGGDVFVPQFIKHTGDVDTRINFLNNKIQLEAGGITFIQMDKDSSTPFPLTINSGGNRINFRVVDKNSELLLKTDSEAFKVNLYHAGNQKLETAAGGVNITGEITASGNISSSGNVIAETGSFDNSVILKAPNGNQFRFTINNSGHLSLTGSAV